MIKKRNLIEFVIGRQRRHAEVVDGEGRLVDQASSDPRQEVDVDGFDDRKVAQEPRRKLPDDVPLVRQELAAGVELKQPASNLDLPVNGLEDRPPEQIGQPEI